MAAKVPYRNLLFALLFGFFAFQAAHETFWKELAAPYDPHHAGPVTAIIHLGGMAALAVRDFLGGPLTVALLGIAAVVNVVLFMLRSSRFPTVQPGAARK